MVEGSAQRDPKNLALNLNHVVVGCLPQIETVSKRDPCRSANRPRIAARVAEMCYIPDPGRGRVPRNAFLLFWFIKASTSVGPFLSSTTTVPP